MGKLLDKLREAKANLVKVLENGGTIETQEGKLDIPNEILMIEQDIQRLEQEDKDVLSDKLVKAYGPDGILYFLESNLGKKVLDKKIKADADRSNKMKGPVCPDDFFRTPIVERLIAFLGKPKVQDIGLFITCSSHFEINTYTGASLEAAFYNATGITIAEKNWQNWRKPLTRQQEKDKRYRYAKRFSKFFI
jgi:hypothetical protein